MKQSSIAHTLFVFGLVLVLFAGLGLAQTSKGAIGGTVTDASGAVVAGATVSAKGALGETRTTVSGPNGQFRFDAITPDTYTVSITMQGFAPLAIEGVNVTASVVTSVNGKLQVGSSQQTVTVEASAASIQTESGELSHSMSTTEITQLPINNLNPISLVLTQPGVLSVASRDKFTNGTSFSVNGTRPRANNFLIDGQDNNDTSINGQALQPQNSEAVGEVVILTNAYSSEFAAAVVRLPTLFPAAELTNCTAVCGTSSRTTCWIPSTPRKASTIRSPALTCRSIVRTPTDSSSVARW